METSFFVGRLNIVPIKNSRLGRILCQVFEVMHCNALTATRLAAMDFFRIPPNQVIELGSQAESRAAKSAGSMKAPG